MRRNSVWSLATLLLSASFACAQSQSVTADESPAASAADKAPPKNNPPPGDAAAAVPLPGAPGLTDNDSKPLPGCPAPCIPSPRFYASGEYLLWRICDAPDPFPFLTTGSFGVDGERTGTIGLPSTQVLLGEAGIDYGSLSGARMTAGLWLDSGRRLGIEGSGFVLSQTGRADTVSSNGQPGSQALFVPFVNGAGQSRAFILGTLANPPPPGVSPIAGAATLSSNLKLWGAESTAVLNVARGQRWNFDALGGFCYRQLDEGLRFDTTSTAPSPGTSAVGTTDDQFGTRNEFYGGLIGLRGEFDWRRLAVRAQAQVDIGTTEQEVGISGTSTFQGFSGFGALTPISGPGGVYTQTSNIGTSHHSAGTCIPELQVQVSYQPFSWARLFVGYDALYWSNVVRPGNQVSPVINTLGGIGEPLFGLHVPGQFLGSAPAPQFNTSSVWVQGISFGLEFRF